MALRELSNQALAGRTEISEEEQAKVPPSAMKDLVDALDQIRRLARHYSLITAAEAIMQIFGDMAGASRAALARPGPNDKIMWFLLQQFLTDRINEFTHAYREDLGLGRPTDAPKRWPIRQLDRRVPMADSERIVRAHIPPKKPPTKSA
jgi:hypothetical protein